MKFCYCKEKKLLISEIEGLFIIINEYSNMIYL